MNKRFSVIIAVYNRAKYIGQAIESVLSQTFADYEFIVVDDGSTDETVKVLQSYGSRITVIRQENQGSEMAYKTGVSRANGEYIAFLDSDDYFLPHALATYDKVIRALDSPPIIIGAMERFTENQAARVYERCADHIEALKYRDYLSKDITVGLAQSRIVMRKSVFEDAQRGTGRPRARNMNDYRLMLRAGTRGPCVVVTRPVTLAYRHHDTQSSKNIEKMGQGLLYLIDLVREGQCPAKRKLEQYAYLAGPVLEWSKKALRSRLRGLAVKILLIGSPMLLALLVRKLIFLFQSPTAPVTINASNTIAPSPHYDRNERKILDSQMPGPGSYHGI